MINPGFVTTSAASDLAIVTRELRLLTDRLADAALIARALAAATDWQASAATAFHDKSELWAGDVSGLACLTETALADAERAHRRAVFLEAAPFAAALAPSATR